MDSIWNRVITRLTNTRSGERTVAFLMFAYSFLAMTSHNILKPVTKSKFIDQLGSDNLPYVLLASSVLIGMLMHFYASAARRVPRKYVIPITQAILVALLVIFWALLRNGAVWVTVALYFFAFSINRIMPSYPPSRSSTSVTPGYPVSFPLNCQPHM